MPPTCVSEPQVRFFTRMPKGYQFVPKGDVYVTSNVRKRTHAVGAPLYVVVDKHKKPIGLRCPIPIYQEVAAAAQASAINRAAVVQGRDAALEREFEAELRRLYPKIPEHEVGEILKQTMEKRKKRVGRTGTLELDSRVHLAVKAYIRHCHTPYEQLLDDGVGRETARQMVTDKLQEEARSWTGNTSRPMMHTQGGTTNVKRKTRNWQHVPRKRKATGRSTQTPAQPGSRLAESKRDVEVECSPEDSGTDFSSNFGDDPEESDWIP